jgi:hypothetical protein
VKRNPLIALMVEVILPATGGEVTREAYAALSWGCTECDPEWCPEEEFNMDETPPWED